MKKFLNFGLFIMLATLSLVLVSCGSDSDDSDVSVVGAWEITSISYDSAFDVEEDEGYSEGDIIFFDEDGSYFGDGDEGRYSYDGKTLTLYPEEDKSDPSISLPAEFKVLKLTSEEMELVLDYGFFSAEMKLKRIDLGSIDFD